MTHWCWWRTCVKWGKSGWKPTTKGITCLLFFLDYINNVSLFSEEVARSLSGMLESGVLNKDTFQYLLPRNARTSRFYILPKIHKTWLPGRPIVSSCEASTENVYKFVDCHLGPLIRKIPSYIKDTNHFLLKLRGVTTLPTESLLVTLDVTSFIHKHSSLRGNGGMSRITWHEGGSWSSHEWYH